VVPTGKPEFKPGTGRGHVCGTREDFEEGGIYDPLAPDATYGVQGLPTCCAATVPLSGGVADGGSVSVSFTVPPGSTCATAKVIGVGQPQTFTVGAFDTHWFVTVGSVGVAECWRVVTNSGGVTRQFLTGNSCAGLSVLAELFPGGCPAGATVRVVPFLNNVYLTMSGGGIGGNYTVERLT